MMFFFLFENLTWNNCSAIRISEPSGDAEDISLLSPEEREKRRSFESKRKKHYNEFQAVKMARALMDEDDSEVLTLLLPHLNNSILHRKTRSLEVVMEVKGQVQLVEVEEGEGVAPRWKLASEAISKTVLSETSVGQVAST